MEKKICTVCETQINQPIGYSRKNGKSHHDWETRTMHKACYIKQQHLSFEFFHLSNQNLNRSNQ